MHDGIKTLNRKGHTTRYDKPTEKMSVEPVEAVEPIEAVEP